MQDLDKFPEFVGWPKLGEIAAHYKMARAFFTDSVAKTILPGMTISWQMNRHVQTGTVVDVGAWGERVNVRNEKTKVAYWISVWAIVELSDAIQAYIAASTERAAK